MSNDPSPPSGTSSSDLFTPQRIVALVLAVIAVSFILQNRADVTLNLLGIRVTGPLWLSSLVVLGVGIAIGVLLSARRRSSR